MITFALFLLCNSSLEVYWKKNAFLLSIILDYFVMIWLIMDKILGKQAYGNDWLFEVDYMTRMKVDMTEPNCR